MLRRIFACSRWTTQAPLTSTQRALYASRDDPKDFYKLLGISKTATADEIKKAYRRKAIEKHPDQGGNSEEFAKINEAYSILSDTSKRSMYDQYGAEGVSDQGAGSPGFNPEDIFSQFFGGQQRQQQAAAEPVTEDKAVSVSVTLTELYKGETKTVRIRRPAVCMTCMGNGSTKPGAKKMCGKCSGTGQETIVNQVGPGMVQQFITTCRTCKGKGKSLRREDACNTCNGEGFSQEAADVDVPLNSTVFPQDILLMRAKAGCIPGAAPGDLHVQVEVRSHPTFQRKGFDLITKRSISLVHALTGGDITLTHLDGREIVVRTTPRDILNSGMILLVRGEGMPRNNGTNGNLYVVLDLQIPRSLSPQQQTELKKIFGDSPVNTTAGSRHVRSPDVLSFQKEEFFENKSHEWTKIESSCAEIAPGVEKISREAYGQGQHMGGRRRRSRGGGNAQQCQTA